MISREKPTAPDPAGGWLFGEMREGLLTFIAWPGRDAVWDREQEAIAANMSILARSTTSSRPETAGFRT
jgi:hypothetical protein